MEISLPSTILTQGGHSAVQGSNTVQVKGSEAEALKTACAEMESLFIFHLLQEMRTTVPKEGLLHGGMGEEVFTSLMDGEMARSIALERGLGLAKLMESQLSRHLDPEAAQAVPPPKVRVKI